MKKGSKVWLIKSWDDKGTFCYAPYNVLSAGKRQVHLVSDDGKNLKTRIYRLDPIFGTLHQPHAAENVLFDRSIDPVAKALELAAAYLVEQRAFFAERIQRFPGDVGYVRSIEKSVAELHEPRAVVWEAL